jgi:glycosyltransferase involved in cell wall biosynthesis
MKQIRVLQVLTSMNRGGAETMIMNYYRNIDRSKVQFDFLLHREEEGSFDKEILELGGKIYKMCPIHPLTYLAYKKKLKLFFCEHPEYKIVHSHLNALSFIILDVAARRGISTRIAHSHIAIEPFKWKYLLDKNSELKNLIKDLIFSVLRNQVSKNATHFFACGIKAGNWLFGPQNASKYQVIHNAIDTTKFRYSEVDMIDYLGKMGVPGKKIIGHIGRFDNQKNHGFLIDVFAELHKINSNVILFLIGEGGLKQKIENRVEEMGIKDSVFFLGVRKDIPQLINTFDLFLFPSFYEGLPLTLIEAQAAGIPIVASDTISREVEITDLITFLSLEKSNTEWANKINILLVKPKENTISKIKEAGYDIQENAKNLEHFYLNNNF